MIDITAKLLKGAVYLTGEDVKCSVSFNHTPSSTHKISQSNNDAFECLAWASAQIVCYCAVDEKFKRNRTTTEGINELLTDTALSASTFVKGAGYIEFISKPKILFCDLRLSPGQVKTYIFEEKIPMDSPPSFRGQLVKYSYKLVIGSQRVSSPIKLLRVSLRVLPVSIIALNEINGMCNDTTEDLAPANPFLEVKQSDTPFEITLQTLQNITARRKPNFYIISNTWGKVARFCLFKPAYKLGEDIVGIFDFTIATVICVQFSVSLQCEEETYVHLTNNEKIQQCHVLTFNKHHDVCLGLKYTQLVLPIPLHVAPAFSTSLMNLKWRLHFEFVTSTNKALENISLDESGWQAPTDLSVETMVWSLPIKIFSATPLQISQGLQTNNMHTLRLL